MTLVIDVSCKGSPQTRRFVLQDQQTLEVGRSNAELKLFSDARLSRKHFSLRYDGGRVEVTHHSRTNPTLIAPAGSRDFEKVRGSQWADRNCRLIAGSHRFVLTIEKPDSVIAPTLSGEENSNFWSDVDDDQEARVPGGAQTFENEDPAKTRKRESLNQRQPKQLDANQPAPANTDKRPAAKNDPSPADHRPHPPAFGDVFDDDDDDDEDDDWGQPKDGRSHEQERSSPIPPRRTKPGETDLDEDGFDRDQRRDQRRDSTTVQRPAAPTQDVSKGRRPATDRANSSGKESPSKPPAKPFDDDDSGSGRKPFFPISDDFFDD